MLNYGSQSNKAQADGGIYSGMIDKTHQEIHDGHFITTNYLETGVANNATIQLRVITGAKSFHVMFYIDIEGKIQFKTIVGSTYTVAGTLPDGVKLTKFNRKSTSTYVETTTFRYAPTVNVAGSLRGNRMFPGGTGRNSVGLSGGDRVESIIGPNSDVLIEIKNVSGQARDIGLIVEGYEE